MNIWVISDDNREAYTLEEGSRGTRTTDISADDNGVYVQITSNCDIVEYNGQEVSTIPYDVLITLLKSKGYKVTREEPTHTSEYDEGYEHGMCMEDGDVEEDCPYKSSTRESREWMKGCPHPATGCQYGLNTIACRQCTIDFWR